MTDFDDRFADRVREVFDGYEEAVDETAWARTQAALGAVSGPAAAAVPEARTAPDRPPAARAGGRRTRGLVVLLVLLVVGGGVWGLWQAGQTPRDVPALADAQESAPPAPPRAPSPDGARESDVPAPVAPPAMAPGTPSAATPDLALAAPPPAPSASNARATAPPPSAARAERGRRSTVESDGSLGGRAIAAVPEAVRERADAPAEVSAAPDAEPTRASDARAGAEAAAPLVRREPEPQRFAAFAQADAVVAPQPSDPAARPARTSRVGVVVATNAAFSGRQLAEGVGVTGGVTGEWRLGRGLSVSTGAQAAYTTLSIDAGTRASADSPLSFDDLQFSPTGSVDVPAQSTLSTLALEVPLDLGLDLARVGRGRVRAGAGLTTSLYLAQSFRDEGRRYSLGPGGVGLDSGGRVSSTEFSETQTEGPFDRLDLARQLNLSLGYSLDRARVPLALDAYTRLPLGGVTSRDLPLTSVGVRLRLGL